MAALDRLQSIKQILQNEKKVIVADLSERFSVTEETIRRDLDKLEAEGFLNRTYGGAILNVEETVANIPFYKRAEHNLEEKKHIASKALELLQSAHTIFADSSTTVMETLKLLKDRDDLTIVTNSTEILREFILSEVNVVCTGGQLNKKTLSLQGDLTENAINNYNVDVAVISCKGIDQVKGVTDTNEMEARIKRNMLKQASKVLLLLDEYKFDKKAFVHLLPVADVDYIVTSGKPSQEWLDYLSEKNISLYY